MKSLCLIPARGGSKRIPRKNIKLFHGKPLICWSIECALKSSLFEKVYVSTDDEEIAAISRDCGAEIPFLRPSNISDDFARDRDVISHFINWMKNEEIYADYLCYLYATVPFITHKTLKGCQELITKKDASLSMAITSYETSPLWAQKIDSKGIINYDKPEFITTRSQDLPEFFHDAGQCYFYNLKVWPKVNLTYGFEIPRILSHDIDTMLDFDIAEAIHPYVMESYYK